MSIGLQLFEQVAGAFERGALARELEGVRGEAGAEAAIARAQESRNDPVVTTVEGPAQWYPAEDYHQGYYRLHPDNPYVQAESMPKVMRFHQKVPNLLTAQ